MKCPHCDYVVGSYWNEDELEYITARDAERGAFYQLPVDVSRKGLYSNSEVVSLYACPRCKKTFID